MSRNYLSIIHHIHQESFHFSQKRADEHDDFVGFRLLRKSEGSFLGILIPYIGQFL